HHVVVIVVDALDGPRVRALSLRGVDVIVNVANGSFARARGLKHHVPFKVLSVHAQNSRLTKGAFWLRVIRNWEYLRTEIHGVALPYMHLSELFTTPTVRRLRYVTAR